MIYRMDELEKMSNDELYKVLMTSGLYDPQAALLYHLKKLEDNASLFGFQVHYVGGFWGYKENQLTKKLDSLSIEYKVSKKASVMIRGNMIIVHNPTKVLESAGLESYKKVDSFKVYLTDNVESILIATIEPEYKYVFFSEQSEYGSYQGISKVNMVSKNTDVQRKLIELNIEIAKKLGVMSSLFNKEYYKAVRNQKDKDKEERVLGSINNNHRFD